MVKTSNIVKGAIVLGGVAAFFALGGTKGIGQRIGSGLKGFGDALISPFNLTPQQKKGTLSTVVDDLQLGGQVTNVPKDDSFASERDRTINRESLALAGLFQSVNSDVKVDVAGRKLIGSGFVQPIDFVFNKEGRIRTGTSGLGSATLAAQARLSEQYGIATFDQSGAISTVGGLVSDG